MIETADYQIIADVLLANQAKIEAEIEQVKADYIKDHSPFQVGDWVLNTERNQRGRVTQIYLCGEILNTNRIKI